MTLLWYHNISFIQNEHSDTLHINCFKFDTPVKQSTRSTDYDLIFYCISSRNWQKKWKNVNQQDDELIYMCDRKS